MRLRHATFVDLTHLVDQQTVAAPTTEKLRRLADKLYDVSTVPWQNRVPTAMDVSDLAEELDDRPPTIPSVGQVKSILKHLNPRKVQELMVQYQLGS